MFRSKSSITGVTIMNRLVLIASIVISALLIVVSSHAGVSPVSGLDEKHLLSTTPVKPNQSLEGELVMITPDGFEPQEIERPAGRFLLSITNRSGIESLTIRLENEQHGKVREKSLPLETPYWREVINPPPGRYTITEANHPEWTFSLVIR
jgi:hypothetical protein